MVIRENINDMTPEYWYPWTFLNDAMIVVNYAKTLEISSIVHVLCCFFY